MRKLNCLLMSLFSLALLYGCGGDETLGSNEPFLPRSAQFFEGPLPGGPAGTPSPEGRPTVTSIEFENPLTIAGQAQKTVKGRVSSDAFSVGVRLRDHGTGFWVVPIGVAEPQNPGESIWSLRADISPDLPPGPLVVVVVAFDENGNPGSQREANLCIRSKIPDNGASCFDDRTVPDAVIVLDWYADADLDLEVLTPEGRLVTPKHPLVDPPSGSGAPPADAARITNDSLGSCISDGFRQESLVFQKRPAPGTTYQIYANLFSACGVPSIPFTISIYEARGEGEERELVKVVSERGLLNARDANGGVETGLLVIPDYGF